MKNYILIFSLLVSFNVLSQEEKIKGTPVEGIISIKRNAAFENIAPNAVNYQYSSSNAKETPEGNPDGDIELDPDFDPDPNDPSGNPNPHTGSGLDVSTLVYSTDVTKGDLSVSLSGGANYNIPIISAPGINGTVPQIGLSYNSQAGNGNAGFGWNISGVSVISRIPATKYHDNTIDAIDYDALDRFAFDGQRLILKNTSQVYGADGVEYQTENYSNIKITSHGVSPFGASFGPSYFLIQYPDGSKAYYGQNANSLSRNDWAITYWENPLGVRISYEYFSINNILFISKIKYGSLNLSNPINEIQFIYKNRSRHEQYNIGGVTFINNKILSSISVKGNGVGLRNYILAHDVTSLGYERLISITEKTGDNSKSLLPTFFKYDNTFEELNQPVSSTTNVTDVTNLNSQTVTGDFNADGKMDYILFSTDTNYKNKYWLYTDLDNPGTNYYDYQHNVGNFEDIFSLSYVNSDNKLMDFQGWSVVTKNNNLYNFTVYCKGITNPILNQYTRAVNFPTTSVSIQNCGGGTYNENKTYDKKIISGDFNGDGLTDVLAFDTKFTYYNYTVNPCFQVLITSKSKKVYFIDLNQNINTNYYNYAGDIAEYIKDDTKIQVGDFNGDGKSDVYIFDNNIVRIYSLNENNQLVQIYSYSDVKILTSEQILLGDYNGDGKSDFIITKTGWGEYNQFNSAGTSIIKEEKNFGFGVSSNMQLIPTDIDNDGKTDLVESLQAINQVNVNNQSYAQMWVIVHKNMGNNFAYSCDYKFTRPNTTYYALPIFLNPDKKNLNLELAYMAGNGIYYTNSKKNSGKEMLLKEITLGNGLKEKITYSPLEGNGDLNSDNIALYTPVSDYFSLENFPNFDVKLASNFMVVSKLEMISKDSYKKQLFGYHGAIVNMQGQGFLGFKSILRTNLFNDSHSRISNVSRYDISKKGAISESFSVLNALYNIQLTPTSGFITKTLNTNYFELLPNKVFKIQNHVSTTYNGLDDTSVQTYTGYDQYNNPNGSSTLYNSGSTNQKIVSSTIDYENLPSSIPYIIGRPIKKNLETFYEGDTMTSEEIYSYNSSQLLSQIKKKGHNTNYIIEDNSYDVFGNITQKAITATGLAPRVTNYEYDSSGRFLTKSFDIEGLKTEYTYDLSSGLLLTETNPYGLTTTYSYDAWLRKRKITDYLGNSKKYLFQMYNTTDVRVSTYDDDGGLSFSVFDDLGREYLSGNKKIDDTWSYIKTSYDIYNREKSISEPYSDLTSNPTQQNTKVYDAYGRLSQSVAYTGKTTNVAYSGLSSTVNDGFKTVTTIKDATGNVKSLTDNGGTITYQYFANSNLKKSIFDSVETIIEQDGWGRKTKLTDPSAGVYEYTYNELGETTWEKTPNGETTYSRDNFGKITTKSVTNTNGSSGNTETYYYYNPITKLLDYIDSLNWDEGYDLEYFYTYDTYNRIISKVEYRNDNAFQFTSEFEYDSFGRVSRERSKAETNGKTVDNWIKHTYKNGYHWQILDDATSAILWQTNNVNARGQLTSANFGNGIAINKTYDTYGNITQSSHFNVATPSNNLMTLNTVFEPLRSNLTSRYNSMFNWNESFQYDSLDRLTHYTNELGQQIQQTYETDGRIKQNNIGLYNYLDPDPTKKYRNTSIEPSPESEAFYRMKEGIFFDTMEKKLGWQNYDPANITFDSTFSNTSNGGSVSLKINNTTTSEKIIHSEVWVPIDNNVPTEYTYSGWVYTNAPSAEIFLFMKTENETGYYTQISNVYSQTPNQWVFVEKTVLVPANIKRLNLRLDNNGLGTIWFDNVKIRKTSNPAVPIDEANKRLNVSYNAFKSPVDIFEPGNDRISFTYNVGNNRSSMHYGSLEVDKALRKYHKYYSGINSVEIKYNSQSGAVEFVSYVGGDAYSAPVVLKSDGTNKEYLYLHRDYLGSIVAISNQAGNIVEKRLFDAWGNIIKIQDGAGNILSKLVVLDRGYTGHEHLQSVGIIHMNGRLYDPLLHRFLQPDNNIQDPYNTQNYNRYGYVLNNPLKYNDPSGEFWNIVAGAVIGGAIAAIQGGNFGDIVKGALVGAVAGLVGGGVASLAAGGSFFSTTVATGFWSGAFAGSAGGFTGAFAGAATATWLNGGSFDDGMTAGLLASPMGIVSGGAFGGLSGGYHAYRNDNNFWSGQSNWKTIAGGTNAFKNPITNEYDFSDNWKTVAELKSEFERISQQSTFDCGPTTKLMNDNYFGLNTTGKYSAIDKAYYRFAKGNNGLSVNTMKEYFLRTGKYAVEEVKGGNFQWAIKELNKNRVVNALYKVDGYGNHWSPIYSIQEHIKTRALRALVADPSSLGIYSIDAHTTIHALLSVGLK